MLRGVLPIVPTPFHADGTVDGESFDRVIEYGIAAGAHGLVFPAIASEYFTLSDEERRSLSQRLVRRVAGRVPVVIGVSSPEPEVALGLAKQAEELGAQAVLMLVPAVFAKAPEEALAYIRSVSRAVGLPIMLQNAPAPLGADLPVDAVARICREIDQVRYVKEEGAPSGQRIGALIGAVGRDVEGVFGGDGGRSILSELARGAAGTMPAIELTEVFVALFEAYGRGERKRAADLFARMLPLLNMQRIFRWALTKAVLVRRGIIRDERVRVPGAPLLDAVDREELDVWLEAVRPLLVASPA